MRGAWLWVAGLALVVAGTGAGAARAGELQGGAPLRLTLGQAIELGLEANLNAVLAEEEQSSSAAESERARAALLPRVTAESYASLANHSLVAQGLEMRGVPQVVGPLSNYDFRVAAQQSVVDRERLHGWRASRRTNEAARASRDDVRDQIVRLVAGLYLGAETAEARAAQAEARVADAERLDRLARDRHDAGKATGVDVLRADVELAHERQARLAADNGARQARLRLGQAIGLDPSRPIELEEKLGFTPQPAREIEALMAEALAVRADYRALESQRAALTEQQRANRARLLPRLSVGGNFGGLGRSVGGVAPIGAIQGQIDVTVYDHDRGAEADLLASRRRSLEAQMAELRRGIGEQLRAALLDIASAEAEVEVARSGLELASRELELARDRFSEGTTTNVEVVTAQDELARAEEDLIVAESGHADARFALDRALGGTAGRMEQAKKIQ